MGELIDAEIHRFANDPIDLDSGRLAVKMGNRSMIPVIAAFFGEEALDVLVESYY